MTDIGKTHTMTTRGPAVVGAAGCPDPQAVKRRAREIWDENQASLPRFVRRPPDQLDLATGAWARVVRQAQAELTRRAITEGGRDE